MPRHAPRIAVPCANCGKETLQKPCRVREKNYCDRKCRHTHMYNDVEDFWKYVDKRGPDECWYWLGAKHKKFEHGRYRWKGQERTAHSVAHEIAYGVTEGVRGTQGILMRHKCDVPFCVNPAHIIPGTAKDNTQDMMERKRHKPTIGELSGAAKLTEKDVIAIRSDPRTHAEIGQDYGVTGTHIGFIKARKSWKHI